MLSRITTSLDRLKAYFDVHHTKEKGSGLVLAELPALGKKSYQKTQYGRAVAKS